MAEIRLGTISPDNDPVQAVAEANGFKAIRTGRATGDAGVESKVQTLFENKL